MSVDCARVSAASLSLESFVFSCNSLVLIMSVCLECVRSFALFQVDVCAAASFVVVYARTAGFCVRVYASPECVDVLSA